MGALTAFTKWIPEDDLLLKNAVEAGASLESLAKGAVRFSRRFTLRELQDRWYSLLYDPDTSAEASARIIEFEIELSISNPSKANRACNSKGKDSSAGKRKGESIRSHYYARRKRVCNEPYNSADLGFLVPPCSNVTNGGDYGPGGQLTPHNQLPVDNIGLGAPIFNCYGHLETGYGSREHVFPEMLRDGSAAASGNIAHHAFHTEHVGPVEDEFPDNTLDRDCLFGYTDNILPLTVDKAGGGHDYIEKDSQKLQENHFSSNTCLDVQGIKPLQTLPVTDLCDTEIDAKPLSIPDSNNVNHDGFIENNNISSQVPECDDSIHQLGCSSAAPGHPIWGTIQDISAPSSSNDVQCKDKEQGMLTIDNSRKMDTARCDRVTAVPKLNDEISDVALNNPVLISESDFMDFSNSYMDFADDEEMLLFDVDEKDIPDASCLNGLGSILLSSPSDSHIGDIPISTEPKTTEVLDASPMNSDRVCSGGTNEACGPIPSEREKAHSVDVSEVSVPSDICHTADPLDRFVICTLNTEDPEIPCNDDVILPDQVLPQYPASSWEHNFKEHSSSISSSIKLQSTDGKSTVGDFMVKPEQVANSEPLLPSMKAKPSLLPKMGSMHPTDGCIAETKPFESDSIAGVSRHGRLAANNPNSCASTKVALHSAAVAASKVERTTPDLVKYGNTDTCFNPFLEKQVPGSGLSIAYGCKQEPGMQSMMQNCVPSHSELVSADFGLSDTVATVSTSDQEERKSDSENDMPNFSDIEDMILDMDLGPYDQESCLFTKEVSRYQSVDSKKAIIKLEQGAHSYMNRAISSRGAFAIFYGRRLKCFIKNPEVSLGRATEDVKVDIDFGREGRANKISRRQAIIKMDEDGSFVLKNIGKCSIFVNSKEVQSKKRISLSSGSLIEIRDMRFIFEVNQSAVRHYINTLRGSSQEQHARFDWIQGQNP